MEVTNRARYFFRRGLARLPYFPLPVRLKLSDSQQLRFWWSHVEPFFDPSRGFRDYWGKDIADLRFVWNILPPQGIFFDIGAYHGIYSVVAAARLEGQGSVFAFEPSPPENNRLRLHLKMNGLKSVTLEALALSGSESRQLFFQVLSGDKTRGGLQKPDTLDPVTEVSIQTTTLDAYAAHKRLNRVDLIKLDVEGAERGVLAGARDVLFRYRPVILCEVLDAATRPWGYPAAELIRILERYDYTWFDLCPDGSLTRHIPQDSYLDVKNYVAFPAEKCREQDRINLADLQNMSAGMAPVFD